METMHHIRQLHFNMVSLMQEVLKMPKVTIIEEENLETQLAIGYKKMAKQNKNEAQEVLIAQIEAISHKEGEGKSNP